MTTKAATPQPMPTAGQQDVLPAVIADLQARDALGRKKYGTTLQTHNGRDALVDVYQEQLDQVMYLKQELLERDLRIRSAVDQLVSLDQLQPGMIVRGRTSGDWYVVTANYGDRVTAVRTQDITNPDEWLIVQDSTAEYAT